MTLLTRTPSKTCWTPPLDLSSLELDGFVPWTVISESANSAAPLMAPAEAPNTRFEPHGRASEEAVPRMNAPLLVFPVWDNEMGTPFRNG